MSSEQSTREFLFSREGRPILLGSVGAIVIFGLIGYYSYTALYGGAPEQRAPTAEQQAAAGETRVRATNQNQGPTNLTSENLNRDARAALAQFNEQASQQGRMGQPTPDDVFLIPVENNSSQTPPQEPEPVEPQFTQRQPQAPAQPQMTPEQRRLLARAEEQRQQVMLNEALEYRSRRFQAANEMIALYSTPAPIGSVSFAGREGQGDFPAAASVALDSSGRSTFDAGDGTSGRNGSNRGGTCESPLITGGEIAYAQTDIALNTDFQGPVKMTFLGGNLNNYIGLGTFELNELGAKMKLRINTLFDPDGQRYAVSGYVLDPETTLWAMSSDVDRHIIYRYGGFGLGTILSAFSILADNRSQISQVTTPDGTVATQNRDPDGKQVTWTMLGEFSRLFETAFRDNINRPITVTLDPEEEAGVLFEDTVCPINSDISRDRAEQQRRMAEGLADPIR